MKIPPQTPEMSKIAFLGSGAVAHTLLGMPLPLYAATANTLDSIMS